MKHNSFHDKYFELNNNPKTSKKQVSMSVTEQFLIELRESF